MVERRLPAEWEPQSGIMLTWPHEKSDWHAILANVEPVFAEICKQTSLHETVLIVARDATHQRHIQDLITSIDSNMQNVMFAIAESNDSWARDHGAISVWQSDELLLLDFQFNAWGGKYDFQFDNEITAKLQQQGIFARPVENIAFVLEGGSIESDGKGTLLTTRCLLSNTRNPGWSQEKIEQALKKQFGVDRILWLYHGELAGDDTDAHIDTLARFTSSSQITYVKCDNEADEHFASLLQMEQELAALRTLDGKPYDLIPLPLPDPIYNKLGQRLPATYANFLIINDVVLLPVYGQQKDELALNALKKCFPSRDIVTINCLPLIEQFGSLHCVTMQFPAGVLASPKVL